MTSRKDVTNTSWTSVHSPDVNEHMSATMVDRSTLLPNVVLKDQPPLHLNTTIILLIIQTMHGVINSSKTLDKVLTLALKARVLLSFWKTGSPLWITQRWSHSISPMRSQLNVNLGCFPNHYSKTFLGHQWVLF